MQDHDSRFSLLYDKLLSVGYIHALAEFGGAGSYNLAVEVVDALVAIYAYAINGVDACRRAKLIHDINKIADAKRAEKCGRHTFAPVTESAAALFPFKP